MANAITIPRSGWSMEEGTFVHWLKAQGETVAIGEPLFVLESEKATENVAALDTGILQIPADAPKPGDTVKVGQVIGYLAAAGEEVRTLALPVSSPLHDRPQRAAVTSPPPPGAADRIVTRRITPRARRIAAELGIATPTLTGTGRNGRIRERDVRAALQGEGGRLVPHSPARRLIAARVSAGVTQAAPVTMTMKVDASEFMDWRKRISAKPSVTACLIKLAAVALRDHPQLQGQWRDDAIFFPAQIHIAVAIDTVHGLFAPVIRSVDQLALAAIDDQLNHLQQSAQANKLASATMRDGTFTVSNLGIFGIDAFTPIVQLPQAAILGIGRIVREPALVADQIVPRDMVTLSLTVDHRVVDGAPAARFLRTLRQLLEHPAGSLS